MRHILILGAGKSSTALIDYLAKYAKEQKWRLTVGDINRENALQKTKGLPHTKAVVFDASLPEKRRNRIAAADVVVSMLPAAQHIIIAKDCLELKKHLVTPSYISDEMAQLNHRVKKAGLVFMNEMGLDPGIDHMSAMHLLDNLRAEGAAITGFESHCGGLVAPKSDTNLWHYKFTWNPRNVVLAGQGDGGIHYLKNGKPVNLHYKNLFAKPTPLEVDGYGKFESYPNRDSLKYQQAYGLHEVKTLYRGTLRIPPFCKGWNTLIQLGLTSPTPISTPVFIRHFDQVLKKLNKTMDRETNDLLLSLALLPKLYQYSAAEIVPADFLQAVLEKKWKMSTRDKDMIVMVHRISYQLKGKSKHLQASLVVTGKDSRYTAMAMTVGWPMAMAVKMILNGEIKRTGVLMPVYPEIYNPILAELSRLGIAFKESES